MHTIADISNTECAHLTTGPQEGPPAASPGHDNHRVEKEGTDKSRAVPRMQSFGTTARVGDDLSRRHTARCPLSATQRSS